MSYSVVDVADLPTVWGTFKFVRHHLGARAFGLSQIDFPPGQDRIGARRARVEAGRGLPHALGRRDARGRRRDDRDEARPLRPRTAGVEAAARGRAGRDVVPRHRRRARRRLRALDAPGRVIVRILLWRLDERTPSFEELRDRIEKLEPLVAPGAFLAQRRGRAGRSARRRRGGRAGSRAARRAARPRRPRPRPLRGVRCALTCSRAEIRRPDSCRSDPRLRRGRSLKARFRGRNDSSNGWLSA